MKLTAISGFALGLSFLAGPAFATHKAWVFTQGGGSCLKAGLEGHLSSSVQVKEGLWNSNPAETKRVMCPVNTSGQSASTVGSQTAIFYPLHDKVAAKGAEVHYVDPSTSGDVQCNMVLITGSGSVLFSDYRRSCDTPGGCDWDFPQVSFTGAGFIDFADEGGVPEGQVRRIGIPQSNVTPNVRSLVYHCYLPKAASTTQWSGITSTVTVICQRDPVSGTCAQ